MRSSRVLDSSKIHSSDVRSSSLSSSLSSPSPFADHPSNERTTRAFTRRRRRRRRRHPSGGKGPTDPSIQPWTKRKARTKAPREIVPIDRVVRSFVRSSSRAPLRLFGELRLVDEILARVRAEVLLRVTDRHLVASRRRRRPSSVVRLCRIDHDAMRRPSPTRPSLSRSRLVRPFRDVDRDTTNHPIDRDIHPCAFTNHMSEYLLEHE